MRAGDRQPHVERVERALFNKKRATRCCFFARVISRPDREPTPRPTPRPFVPDVFAQSQHYPVHNHVKRNKEKKKHCKYSWSSPSFIGPCASPPHFCWLYRWSRPPRRAAAAPATPLARTVSTFLPIPRAPTTTVTNKPGGTSGGTSSVATHPIDTTNSNRAVMKRATKVAIKTKGGMATTIVNDI
jgi:hypothetical protein